MSTKNELLSSSLVSGHHLSSFDLFLLSLVFSPLFLWTFCVYCCYLLASVVFPSMDKWELSHSPVPFSWPHQEGQQGSCRPNSEDLQSLHFDASLLPFIFIPLFLLALSSLAHAYLFLLSFQWETGSFTPSRSPDTTASEKELKT